MLLHLYLNTSKILSHLLFVISITNLSDTRYSISISLCLILTSMLIHLVHEIVKILNVYTRQPVMLSLEI